MSGVNSTDKKNVHPNPMRLLAPTNPTNADTKVSDSNPKINNVKPIVLYFSAKIVIIINFL